MKNSLDADARSYIDANVDAEFQGFAWMIAKHESRDAVTTRIYNQFNASGRYKELPNRGAPDGWGMCQIDRSGNRTGINYTTTAETYDWHESVAAMNDKLHDADRAYARLKRRLRNMYQGRPGVQWVEPDNLYTNCNGRNVSAKEWCLLTYYNGAGGCPTNAYNGVIFNQPIEFVPSTSSWIFHNNREVYVPAVMDDRNRVEVE